MGGKDLWLCQNDLFYKIALLKTIEMFIGNYIWFLLLGYRKQYRIYQRITIIEKSVQRLWSKYGCLLHLHKGFHFSRGFYFKDFPRFYIMDVSLWSKKIIWPNINSLLDNNIIYGCIRTFEYLVFVLNPGWRYYGSG